jgi:hypothetical protein
LFVANRCVGGKSLAGNEKYIFENILKFF